MVAQCPAVLEHLIFVLLGVLDVESSLKPDISSNTQSTTLTTVSTMRPIWRGGTRRKFFSR
jgi:hypothetical protein